MDTSNIVQIIHELILLRLQWIMSPVLQGFVALAICILLGRLLLGQVSLTISHDFTHMLNVFFIVCIRIFFWVLL